MNGNFQRNFILVLIVSILVISLMTVYAAADSKEKTPSGISARSAALYCPEAESFLFEKCASERLPMASTTKIMTALLAIEKGDLSKVVKIPVAASGIEGSSIYLEAGEEILFTDLLYSVLLQSANDAATALALEISGDIDSFSDLMNQRALQMGLSDTHYENPHGLDGREHYTTAHDLAILSANALQNPIFKEITSTYKHSFTTSLGKERTVVNHNKMLKMYDGTVGVKTGFTKKSGRCLSSAAERDGITLIAVTLDAPDDWRDHKALLNYGFDLLTATDPDILTEREFTIPVIGGEKDGLICFREEIKPFVHLKSEGEIKATVYLPRYIVAPVEEGTTVGKILYKLGEKTVFCANIYAKESTNKDKHNLFNS